jgi:homocysteine S-methyltransferase
MIKSINLNKSQINLKTLFVDHSTVLMEAAVVEQLRRTSDVKLHTLLANAPLIYDAVGRNAMRSIYNAYMALAQQASLPMLVCTPTWRAGYDRVIQSGINKNINTDAVRFMREIQLNDDIKVGGMIGCKNDCYLPDEGLSVEEAEHFHSWQIEALTEGGVDFLIAETLPNVNEALGIARVMAMTHTPYIISFVISRDGRVLDGTTLEEAIAFIDANTTIPPIGFMVNCAHPSFLRPSSQSSALFTRLIGFQGNASSLDHCELENADELKTDDVSEWGELMLDLNKTYGMKILGGCCGTSLTHLQYIVEHQ